MSLIVDNFFPEYKDTSLATSTGYVCNTLLYNCRLDRSMDNMTLGWKPVIYKVQTKEFQQFTLDELDGVRIRTKRPAPGASGVKIDVKSKHYNWDIDMKGRWVVTNHDAESGLEAGRFHFYPRGARWELSRGLLTYAPVVGNFLSLFHDDGPQEVLDAWDELYRNASGVGRGSRFGLPPDSKSKYAREHDATIDNDKQTSTFIRLRDLPSFLDSIEDEDDANSGPKVVEIRPTIHHSREIENDRKAPVELRPVLHHFEKDENEPDRPIYSRVEDEVEEEKEPANDHTLEKRSFWARLRMWFREMPYKFEKDEVDAI